MGMSRAVLLAQYNELFLTWILLKLRGSITSSPSWLTPRLDFLVEKELSLAITLDKGIAYEGASFVVVATPTNYDHGVKLFVDWFKGYNFKSSGKN